MSLLVVEGDRSSSQIASELSALGYEVRAASNLKTAADTCGNAAIEAIICTDQAWAEALAGDFAYLAVVLASADRNEDIWAKAMRAGLSDVWRLPIERREIEERMPAILERARAASSQAAQRLEQHVADIERDQRAGRYIQMGMLPPNPMAIDRYRLRHRIRPSLILSGDFVDYFRISDRYFGFYVADVAGHGASSAFVTVLLKNFSRRLRREYRPSMLTQPGEILTWLNRELLEQQIEKHVAMFMAICDLENDTVTFADAGHFPPAIAVKADGEPRYLEQTSKPVGLFEDVAFESQSVSLEPGEGLVLFTDGVLEVLPQESLADKERVLLDAVQENMDIEHVWTSLSIGAQDAPDDITCLTVVREH